MADPSAVALLLQGLSPDEQQELIDIATYLGEKASDSNPSGYMAEGSVAALLNRASPKVREKFMRLTEAIDTPRFQPFQPKRTEAERADEFGLDPDITQTVKSALDNQDVMASLQRRMGSDRDMPDTPPTMREVMSAAYDNIRPRLALDEGGDAFLPDMTNAAEGISRREVIKRIITTMGGK